MSGSGSPVLPGDEAQALAETDQEENRADSVTLIIVGIMFSLIVKSALDHTFSPLATFADAKSAWQSLVMNSWSNLLIGAQLTVFLLTLVRFYLGAYWYTKDTHVAKNQPLLELICNFVGVFLLFIGFYVTSLLVATFDLFYWAIAIFLVIDMIWFWVAGALFLSVPRSTQLVVSIWQVFDLITIVAIVVLMFFEQYLGPGAYYWRQYLCLFVLVVTAVIDGWWLSPFYVHQDGWEGKIAIIRNRLGLQS